MGNQIKTYQLKQKMQSNNQPMSQSVKTRPMVSFQERLEMMEAEANRPQTVCKDNEAPMSPDPIANLKLVRGISNNTKSNPEALEAEQKRLRQNFLYNRAKNYES